MNDTIEADIEVEFTLNPEVEGARRSLGKALYRPNHQFEGYYSTFIGFVDFENEICQPGETVNAVVHSLFEEQMESLIKIGNCWQVKEGKSLVGNALIKKVIYGTS